ncbi:hypothetical protein LXL04_003314 [Taraxacum kok-saghyz]
MLLSEIKSTQSFRKIEAEIDFKQPEQLKVIGNLELIVTHLPSMSCLPPPSSTINPITASPGPTIAARQQDLRRLLTEESSVGICILRYIHVLRVLGEAPGSRSFLEITPILFHLMHHHRTLVKQDYNRLISRLSIQTQMATNEDKFELAVHSLKINQLAETLGSGGCSLGKAIKRRYTNVGFTTFISSLKLMEDEITSTVETRKEDEDE